MRICITNDDGIRGEGLQVLADWAKKIGEVTIFAPKTEQSGKAHSIELHQAYTVERVDHPSGVRAFMVDSTPADCVRVALCAMNEPFDLVLSGVNRGYNLGREIIYSGTVGAALEAGMQGVKGIALSTGFETFEGARNHLDTAWEYIMAHDLLSRGNVWNVNIPEHPTGEVRFTRQGGRYFSDDYGWDGAYVRAAGKSIWTPTEDLTIDTNAVLGHGCISITPLAGDRTDRQLFEQLIR